ncbi:hypothetical protein [Halobacteriovorax sp. ZH4_bin.1]|uniref:hypothetical protein n=1 Tax=unclassified Halobacteriovorax TaxID=2639665 RepID=UPI00371E177B
MEDQKYKEFLECSELFANENGLDDIYNFNRNEPSRLFILENCEEMWQLFKPFCGDSHFIREFRDKFRQKWWELFLAKSLLDNNITLNNGKSHGPDLCFGDTPKTWIEAISVTGGEEGAPDSVPAVMFGVAQNVPTEKILLRVTSAFLTKANKFKKYIEQGIVGPKDRLVIATDLSGVNFADTLDEDEMPISCKALLGVGELTMSISVDDLEDKRVFYPFREKIKKEIGTDVPATGLLMEQFNFISGVITNVRSFTQTVENPNCLRLICNPYASNDLVPTEWEFLKGVYFVKEGKLEKL